jgi:xanthine dehydrogenase molybdopterin-binding subunit B
MRFSQVKHLAAEAHVSGTATFLADIGVPQGTVHAQFVTSTRAHANIIGLDSTACYEIPARKHLFDCAILYSTKFSRILAKIDSGQQTHRNVETKTRHTRVFCLSAGVHSVAGRRELW